MECCDPVDCGEYAVYPMLVAPNCSRQCDTPEPCYYPLLPRCQKPVYYCCQSTPKKKTSYDCCDPPPQKGCCPPPLPCPRHRCEIEPSCNYQLPPCKPVKTKYIMPCYRYEDGRIANQPTVLMRRACEVACGTRKRKPFVVSSYAADPHNEIRRYHSEDERGNCCFHFERQKPPKCDPCEGPETYQSGNLCQPVHCQECAYVDCVYAHPTNSSCFDYCR